MYETPDLHKADHLIELGRYQEAVDILVEAIAAQRRLYYCYSQLAWCYLQLDKLKESEKILQIALGEYPADGHFHYLYALLLGEQGKVNKGLKHIRIALEDKPSSIIYLTRAMWLHLQNGQRDRAIKYLNLAKKEDPNHIEVIQGRVILLMDRGDFDEAMEAIHHGLEIEPNNVELLSLRSQCIPFTNSFNIQEAEENAYQALSIDPHNESARESLLEVLKQKNWLFRFFAGNAFGQYTIRWTVGTVIWMIIGWKFVFLWAGFGLLYLLLTWYGSVLFNTCLRLHKKYKILLNSTHFLQSNVFLGFNALFALAIGLAYLIPLSGSWTFALLAVLVGATLIALSYFEIHTPKGKTEFYIFLGITGFVLLLAIGQPLFLGALALFGLLLYAFLFTLRVAFE